jgi:hypothetical protein
MDSRDVLVEKENEYVRILRTLRYDPDEIEQLILLFRKSAEFDESTVNTSNESIFGYTIQGSIIRKPKDSTWIDKRSKEYMAPFGFCNHKVVLPAYYKWIKKSRIDPETNHEIIDETCEPDIELIHNLCMVSSNIYFWYLLTFSQKSKLYWLLNDNPKKHVFGHNDPFYKFEDLMDMLHRYVFIRNDEQDVLLGITSERRENVSDEFGAMMHNNIERIVTREQKRQYFFNPITRDIQIEQNLRPYRAFIYDFVKDWLELFDIEDKGGLDARPNIKAVYVFTCFAGR